jgi:short-subunit dehydrogenase
MASTAIVTGYSSGLGKSITKRLLDMGWNVVGVSRTGSTDFPGSYEGKLTVVHGSVALQDTAERAFLSAKFLGTLKLVVNCAGQGYFGKTGTYSADDIAAVLEGNLAGLILFSDMAVSHMRANGGDIVNIMSTASKKIRANEALYTAAKWGAKAYTRTLREGLKAEKSPMRVFEIYPCGMKTAFWTSALQSPHDGSAFPSPEPIAEAILSAVMASGDSYQQELTFERR